MTLSFRACIASLLIVTATAAHSPAQAGATCFGAKATIVGTAGTDELVGTEADDVIVGLGGADRITGLGGADLICSGKGNDRISSGAGPDSVLGGGGRDLLQGGAGGDDLTGSGGNDVLAGGAGGDRLIGGAGDDRLKGGGGSDATIYATSKSPVRVDLDAGRASGQGTDTLSEIELVQGSDLADVLIGSGGRNFFSPGGGNDEIAGSGGFDVLFFFSSGSGITADLEAGTAGGEGSDTFTGIEGLAGSPQDDVLRGDAERNILAGLEGNDTLEGGAEDDYLIGGPGRDTLDGGEGTFDMLRFFFLDKGVRVDLGLGTATGDGADDLVGVEAIFGTDHDDALTGDDGANAIHGAGGDDEITGAGGDDRLRGGEGTDSVDGGEGTDDCTEAESLNACEGEGQAPDHPIEEDAGEVREVLRRHR